MKNFRREDLLFSLCGLNCALCIMKLGGYCPGCGGGAGNQSCSIACCSLEHGSCDYCFECRGYPCSQYDEITGSDSFITHKNQLKDLEKAKKIGIAAYHAEINAKAVLFQNLLENYNDGRRKTFFALAVNLLEVSDICAAVEKTKAELSTEDTLKERARLVSHYIEEAAERNGIILKLRKK